MGKAQINLIGVTCEVQSEQAEALERNLWAEVRVDRWIARLAHDGGRLLIGARPKIRFLPPFQEQLILSWLYLRASSTGEEREALVEARTAMDEGEWTPWSNVLLAADTRVPF